LFVRISISQPRAEAREEYISIEDDLISHFSEQEGFMEAYRLVNDDYVGRLSFWQSQEAADHVANSQHTLSVLSRLVQLELVNERPRLELHFEGTEPKKKS